MDSRPKQRDWGKADVGGSMGWRLPIAWILFALLLLASEAWIPSVHAQSADPAQKTEDPSDGKTAANLDDDPLVKRGLDLLDAIDAAKQAAYQQAKRSVVSVFVSESGADRPLLEAEEDRLFARAFPDRETGLNPTSFGSGIIVGEEGLVLTCYHVIRGALENRGYAIDVLLDGGNSFRAQIESADPRSDLAVLRLLMRDHPPLVAAKLGDGSALQVGETIMVLGNAYGTSAVDGNISASWGTVANLARSAIPETDFGQQALQRLQYLVQVDASLNTGTSGGALVNKRGEFVGITVALSARFGFETPGGFAMPFDPLLRRVIETLREGREMEYGLLGIVPDSIAGRPDIPGSGVLVRSVGLISTRSAGLYENDVIVAANGVPITKPSDLILQVGSFPVGSMVTLDVLRQTQDERTRRPEWKPVTVRVPLAKYAVDGTIVARQMRPLFRGLRVDYLSVLMRRADPINRMPSVGVMVRDVEAGSEASSLGVRSGEIFISFNDTMIVSPDHFDELASKATGRVILKCYDGKQFEFKPEADPQ